MVKCEYCALKCSLKDKSVGKCGVVGSFKGEILNLHSNRGLFASVTPVEAIPFYHYYPGGKTFTLWTVGCPLKCKTCPLKAVSGDYKSSTLRVFNSKELVDLAFRQRVQVFMVSGGEVLIHANWLKRLLVECKSRGLSTALKTIGMVDSRVYEEYSDLVDSILLEYTIPMLRLEGKSLEATLIEAYETIVEQYKHLEVLIPYIRGLKLREHLDSELLKVIVELKDETPIHVLPYSEAEIHELYSLRSKIESLGFKHVYIPRDPLYKYLNTYCPNCKRVVLERDHNTLTRSLLENGECPYCNSKIRVYGKIIEEKWKISRLKLEERVW